ncbi:hypothetical protein AC231_16745 [Clostridium pasteurianum]|uniref:hypothetical protein n=1 Tax=Clostridium pasteurianum TaxID=1501 RepID=UPI00097B148A|nr:hypothetical protein [Clostridium pasteurianum]OMH22020.1 hypothetical protein AC231_16745 [Clostridium pasteurianum]
MKRVLLTGIIAIIIIFTFSACSSLADIGSAFAQRLSSNKNQTTQNDNQKAKDNKTQKKKKIKLKHRLEMY